jgi:Carboxypeptidase regulatory-like domain/TonB-dependent Receptor Plug Domain
MTLEHCSLRIAALMLLACPLALHAQSTTATLTVRVVDASDAAIPRAAVRVENIGTRLQRVSEATSDGQATIPLLPPGTYTVFVDQAGFAPARVDDLVLNVGDATVVRVQLKVATLDESVTVITNADRVSMSPAVSTVVNRQFLDRTPLNGRSLQPLIAQVPGVILTPGAAGQFSVNGQRPDANYMTIDGVSANIGVTIDTLSGQSATGAGIGYNVFGGTSSLLSLDTVQEFQLQTSSASAEFGRQPGGQIVLVTRSGTNQLRGSLFEAIRNEAFDASDWFANRAQLPQAELRQHQFGAALGGPVVIPGLYQGRNRTFFFASYEGLRLKLPTTQNTFVPAMRIREEAAEVLKPFLAAQPLPTGPEEISPVTGEPTGRAPFVVGVSNTTTQDGTSVRIDHTLTGRVQLFGRWNHAPSSTDVRDVGAHIERNQIGLTTVTLGSTTTLTSQLVHELRFNMSSGTAREINIHDSFGGAVPVTNAQFPGGKEYAEQDMIFYADPARTLVMGYLELGPDDTNRQKQWNLVTSLSWLRGGHRLKVGLDWRQLRPVGGLSDFFYYQFQGLDTIRAGTTASTFTHSSSVEFFPIVNNVSAYVDDTWQLRPNLTATLGLRWELNPPPDEATGRELRTVTGIGTRNIQLAPAGTPLYHTRYNNVAPRLGVAWQMRTQPGWETVVRAGGGLHYDVGSGSWASGFLYYPFSQSTGTLTNVPFPPPAELLTSFPDMDAENPRNLRLAAFDPEFRLPKTWDWNVAVEQALGTGQRMTLTYVGNVGRDLVWTRSLDPASSGFASIALTTNEGTSDYHALQAQYQRSWRKGLQALASYSWAHAIDEVSTGSNSLVFARGNADFDVRHRGSAAVTYDLPGMARGRGKVLLSGWSLDGIVQAQSATPMDIVAGTAIDPLTLTRLNIRPNLVPGVPLYLDDPSAPGGRVVNRAAFAVPPAGQQGDFGRNVVRGFPLWQVDLALRRQIALVASTKLLLRFEAFNVLNHPNFGTINTTLTAATFGQATNMLGRRLGGLSPIYQVGGPRSLQFTAKVEF